MLDDEGVFIFDICTKNDLEKNWPDHINIIDKQDYMIISNGEFDQQSKISKIHHNYFLKENDNGTYIRKYDCIEHISFEIEDIINMLRNVNINNIKILDYSQIDDLIWSNQVIKRNIDLGQIIIEGSKTSKSNVIYIG